MEIPTQQEIGMALTACHICLMLYPLKLNIITLPEQGRYFLSQLLTRVIIAQSIIDKIILLRIYVCVN